MDFLAKLPVGHSLRPEAPTVANSLGVGNSSINASQAPRLQSNFGPIVDRS